MVRRRARRQGRRGRRVMQMGQIVHSRIARSFTLETARKGSESPGGCVKSARFALWQAVCGQKMRQFREISRRPLAHIVIFHAAVIWRRLSHNCDISIKRSSSSAVAGGHRRPCGRSEFGPASPRIDPGRNYTALSGGFGAKSCIKAPTHRGAAASSPSKPKNPKGASYFCMCR